MVLHHLWTRKEDMRTYADVNWKGLNWWDEALVTHDGRDRCVRMMWMSVAFSERHEVLLRVDYAAVDVRLGKIYFYTCRGERRNIPDLLLMFCLRNVPRSFLLQRSQE